MNDIEKLGAFYLGRSYDLERSEVRDEYVLYDAKDLTTHAVCVGMTGSGKTGLCATLLEEAALDGIPAIAIDPKGDLGNLLLSFPDLRAEDFRPWIDPAEAARAGRSPDEHARWTADLWRQGLERWSQGGERIQRLRDAAEFSIYTPGGSAGLPLTVLRSFAAPPEAVARDVDALRDRVLSAVSGLLALAGIDADPVRSREHILVSTILDRAWREGRNLELGSLIREIQDPPFERLGVLDLESFFPARERFELATALNGLLASPAFAAWTTGEPLNVGRLLYTPEGRPRISILSIAHLSEAERMFFVTILLGEVLAWVRAQSGTSSLRAILYMDEVYGYFPPTANPPSKQPMLTLLKQARAYGLGVVLATQNPVDLDYKGLSNAGTWFLGRLQTERDKARVLDGLEGASSTAGASFDRSAIGRILSGLDSRVFLMHNVHEDAPVVFHTRWALSYLRGPLTTQQIASLNQNRTRHAEELRPRPGVAPLQEPEAAPSAATDRPILPPKIEERFLPPNPAASGPGRRVYRPAVLGVASLHYVKAPADIDVWRTVALLGPLVDDAAARSPWSSARLLEGGPPELSNEPEAGAGFATLPSQAARDEAYVRWSKMLHTELYRNHPLTTWRCRELRATSAPGETEAQFRIRLRQLLHEDRDLQIEKLRSKYRPKLARLEDRIRRGELRIDREQSQYRQQQIQTAVSVGATVLGALLGRRLGSSRDVGRATTAARGVGRAARDRGDVERARDELGALHEQLKALEAEFEQQLGSVRDSVDDAELELEEVAIRPRKGDLSVERVALVWTPWRVGPDGIAVPEFQLGDSARP